MCKRALEEGRPSTDDVAACWGDSQAAKALGIRTYLSTPLCLEDGTLFGTLCGASTEKRPVTDEGRQVLTLFGSLIQQHVQREHLLERLQDVNRQLESYSFTDPLTGLPNRRFVLQELPRLFAMAQRMERDVLLVFIDLDGFKQINDSYGHEAGDRFLIEVGKRLSTGMRVSDLLGRIGGDEFVLVGLAASSDQDAAATVLAMRRRLAPLIEGRFDLGQRVLDYRGASFGIISVDPHHCTPEQALQQADAAMYQDKKSRRSLYGDAD